MNDTVAALERKCLEYEQKEYMYLARLAESEKEISRLKSVIFEWRVNHKALDSANPVDFVLVDPMVNTELLYLRETLINKEKEISTLQENICILSKSQTSTNNQLLLEELRKKEKELEKAQNALLTKECLPLDVLFSSVAHERDDAITSLKRESESNKCLDEENEALHATLMALNMKLKSIPQ